MGKGKSDLTWFDFIEGLILFLCLGPALHPLFLTLYDWSASYIWGIFALALALLGAGVVLASTKQYTQISLFAFMIGAAWLIQTMMILCSYAGMPLYAMLGVIPGQFKRPGKVAVKSRVKHGKFAVGILCLLTFGLLLGVLPQGVRATAMADIPKSTTFEYRSLAGAAYNMSLDMTWTDNSTSIYKVVYNYSAYTGSSITGNGTVYIKMTNRTIIEHWNGSGSIDLFVNGTETIFYIEPKLKKAATFNGNFPHSSYLSEGVYSIYKLGDFSNSLMARSFENAIHAYNNSCNATGSEDYTIDAVWERATGINLYQQVFTESFSLEMYLSETNFEFPAEPAAKKELNLTTLTIMLVLAMIGLVVLLKGCKRKK